MGRSRNHSLALAIACYLVQLGCDPEVRNRKNKTCADIIADATVWETLVSYVRRRSDLPGPSSSPVVASGESPTATPPSEDVQPPVITPTAEEVNLDDRDCMVCYENPPNVRFDPCGHAIACVPCALRMKKCLECHQVIVSKTSLSMSTI